jgi:uncharacterized protein (DUF427 family)
MKAMWNGMTLAESDHAIEVDGQYYFPPEAVDRRYLHPSAARKVRTLRGEVNYYTIEANGQTNPNAAWSYAPTRDAGRAIEGYVAFWKDVAVEG